MRLVGPLVALVLAGALVWAGWAVEGAVLGVGGLLAFGYRYARVPAERETEEARARGLDPAAKAEMFAGFRARSRSVERALKDTSRRARPFLEPWPSMDPRHPRLVEAMAALRRDPRAPRGE